MTTFEFNSLLIEQSKSLKGFAYNLTRDSEDAADLVQETLLKAIRYKNSFVKSTNFKAWLCTIMKNIFINNYRRNVLKTNFGKETVHIAQRSYNETEDRINTKNLQKLIDELDDNYKVPLERYIEGYKYQEIAEEMQLPIGTIKSRIFLARNQIINKYKPKTIVTA